MEDRLGGTAEGTEMEPRPEGKRASREGCAELAKMGMTTCQCADGVTWQRGTPCMSPAPRNRGERAGIEFKSIGAGATQPSPRGRRGPGFGHQRVGVWRGVEGVQGLTAPGIRAMGSCAPRNTADQLGRPPRAGGHTLIMLLFSPACNLTLAAS